jgi:ribonuclease D
MTGIDTSELKHVSLRLSPLGERILRQYTARRGDVARVVDTALQFILQDDRAYQLTLFPRDHSGDIDLFTTSVRLRAQQHQEVLLLCQHLGVSLSVFIEAALIEADARGRLITTRNKI